MNDLEKEIAECAVKITRTSLFNIMKPLCSSVKTEDDVPFVYVSLFAIPLIHAIYEDMYNKLHEVESKIEKREG